MPSLLFVISMEYLSRILRNIGNLPEFHYHPRCKSLKLTHLCFADNLIMCCKGDLIPYIYHALSFEAFLGCIL